MKQSDDQLEQGLIHILLVNLHFGKPFIYTNKILNKANCNLNKKLAHLESTNSDLEIDNKNVGGRLTKSFFEIKELEKEVSTIKNDNKTIRKDLKVLNKEKRTSKHVLGEKVNFLEEEKQKLAEVKANKVLEGKHLKKSKSTTCQTEQYLNNNMPECLNLNISGFTNSETSINPKNSNLICSKSSIKPFKTENSGSSASDQYEDINNDSDKNFHPNIPKSSPSENHHHCPSVSSSSLASASLLSKILARS